MRDLLLEHNVDHLTAKSIINLFNKHTNYNLPADPRTILKTPTKTATVQIEGGEYYHFGLESAIKKSIVDAKNDQLVYTNNIHLLVNIDGAPLHNSTEKGLWPIQVSWNLPKSVYVVGIFYGPGKPQNVDAFLQMFVNETNILSEGGFKYMHETFTISIDAFICDAPAKCMILNSKGHSGYCSCPTCKIVGKRVDNVTCFPSEIDVELRTDDAFKNLSYLGTYQHGPTILNDICGIGLVTGVPRDYMHLICLGVTRKLLFYGNMVLLT